VVTATTSLGITRTATGRSPGRRAGPTAGSPPARHPGRPVFASRFGGHLDASALRRRFVDATGRAGLRTLPFHSLRHFFGSMAVNKASLVQVQAWMGHAHIQTTARYLHHRTQREDAALLAEAFAREAPVRDPYSTQHPES
jgi:integrase